MDYKTFDTYKTSSPQIKVKVIEKKMFIVCVC